MKSHRKYILIFSLRGNSLVALEDIRVIAFLNITAEETEEAFLERVEFLRESFKVISSEFFFWMTFYCDFDAFYCEFDGHFMILIVNSMVILMHFMILMHFIVILIF
eukprot:GHVP01029947.1.p1 GENE.GHVP01029947.1~~GHVP01029947.1.p1  ORF type:complete len:107 (-),score=18.71 GHVP01029947.1:495-815(-)